MSRLTVVSQFDCGDGSIVVTYLPAGKTHADGAKISVRITFGHARRAEIPPS
jgi:hypothetical protein